MDQSAPNEVPALHAVAAASGSDSSVNQHLPDKHILTPEGYDEVFPTPPDVALSDLNKCLTMFGLDPLDPKLMSGKKYIENRYDEFNGKIVHKLERALGEKLPSLRGSGDFDQVLEQLQKKFESTKDKTQLIQLLSVLPESWSVKKILSHFDTTEYIVKKMKACVQSQGVIPILCPIRSRSGIKQERIEKVREYYFENSREFPGKKDFKSVKQADGTRVHKQKRLVLLNLKELYTLFMKENPTEQISFSKFAELRPAECVLAGASGTHSVCVCIHHENFLLKCEAANLEKTEDGKDRKMQFSEILGLVLCPKPEADCYFRKCDKCPALDTLREILEDKLVTSEDSYVHYKKWTSTDRAELENMVDLATDFVDKFMECVPDVLKHHFISKAQAAFLANEKKNLKDDEVIVTGDFSENYSPVIQDAIQSVHWSKEQVTIHPFVCYYKKPDGTLGIINYVVISDTKDHTNPTVNAFLRQLVPFLKEKFAGLNRTLKRIKYFSDGAASQYKNRTNALNLRMHLKDFGVHAEWHFFASCHGKGPCDGLGGTIKREAARESLQKVRKEGILNAQQLYDWARVKFQHSITIKFLSKSEIDAITDQFKQRYVDAAAAEGIKSSHCILPKSPNMMLMKEYSEAPSCQYLYFGKQHEAQFEDCFGFIIVFYENDWHVAFVNDRHEEQKILEIILLDSVGRRRYKFPDQCKTIQISDQAVITVLNMDADESGFILKSKDVKYANEESRKRYSYFMCHIII